MVPQRWQPFVQLVIARVREFYREPVVLFWVYGFPLLLAIGLSIAFSNSETRPPDVDVQEAPGAQSVAATLADNGFTVEIHPEKPCKDRYVTGKTALVVVPGPEVKYVYDKTRSESVLARYWVEAILLRAKERPSDAKQDIFVATPGNRYIDFLLPGLVGLNLMGGGLFGIGFVLVDMRVRKLFKRLMATPMRHGDFLLALMASRLLFLLPEMFTLMVLARLMFGVPINGSLVTLTIVILLGASAFAGVGLLLGCRTDKTETMSGYINLFMLPQYILSGVFFSPSRFPDMAQPVIQALPLTQVNSALREVMLEGASLAYIGWRLAILAAWTVVCFALALRWFRWG